MNQPFFFDNLMCRFARPGHLIKYGFVEEADILEALSGKREDLHVAVTGRDASPALIDAADLVTEMVAVKHPFEQGIKAQKGIEF